MKQKHTSFKFLSFLGLIIVIFSVSFIISSSKKTFFSSTEPFDYTNDSEFTLEEDTEMYLLYNSYHDELKYTFTQYDTITLLEIEGTSWFEVIQSYLSIQITNVNTGENYFVEKLDNIGSTSINEYTSIGVVSLEKGSYIAKTVGFSSAPEFASFRFVPTDIVSSIVIFVFSILGTIGGLILTITFFVLSKMNKQQEEIHHTDYSPDEDLYDFNEDPFEKYDKN